jgi:MFS transporter, DHA1 family, inner membrane transport protein
MDRRDSRDWRVVLCLFGVLFLGVADNQSLSPLLPLIRSSLSRSSRDMGLLYTVYALSAGLSVLIWGPLSDVFGRKRGLLAGLAVFVVGSLVSLVSTNFNGLLVGRVVTGAGASLLSVNTIAYAADFFPYRHRGWAMSTVFSSYFAALILGVPIGSWIGSTVGWRAVFALGGASAAGLFGITLWQLPRSSFRAETQGAAASFVEQTRSYGGFLNSRQTLAGLAAAFCASAGTTGFLAFLGVWLHDEFGLGARQTALVFLFSGAAAMAASPWAGKLSDQIGKRQQFVWSCVALGALLTALPHLTWGFWLFAVFCLISLATAFRQGPMEALLTELVPSHARGTFVALKNAFSQLGIGASALVGGHLFEGWGYSAVCGFCAIVSLAAAAAMATAGSDRTL